MENFFLAQRPADDLDPNFFSPDAGSAITNPTLGKNLQGLSGEAFIGKFVPAIIGMGLVVGFLIFLATIIMGAIRWISSGGEKAALEDARARITNGIIGVVALFSVFAILRLIEQFFGLDILTIDIGPLKIQ